MGVVLTKRFVLLCALIGMSIGTILAQEQSTATTKQLATVAAARQVKQQHDTVRIIADTKQCAQKNKLVTPALQQLFGALEGSGKIDDMSSLQDGLKEFSGVLARVKRLPAQQCSDLMLKGVTDYLNNYEAIVRNGTGFAKWQSFESVVTKAVYETIPTVIALPPEVEKEEQKSKVTRATSDLAFIAGAGGGAGLGGLSIDKLGAIFGDTVGINADTSLTGTTTIGNVEKGGSVIIDARTTSTIGIASSADGNPNILIATADIISDIDQVISIGTGILNAEGSATQTINIGTGTNTEGTRTVNVGALSQNTITNVQGPTNINASTSTAATTIGNMAGGIITLDAASTSTVQIAANASPNIFVGTADITDDIDQVISIGTGILNAEGLATQTINIGTGTNTAGTRTITIGTGTVATDAAQAIQIGTGAVADSGTNAITIGSTTATTVNVTAQSSSASTYKQADGTYVAPSYTFSNSSGGNQTGKYFYADTTRVAATKFTIKGSETFNVSQGPAIASLPDNKFVVAYVTATIAGVWLQILNANYSTTGYTAVQVDTAHDANGGSGAAVAYDPANNRIVVAWIKADGGVYVAAYTIAATPEVSLAATLVSDTQAAAATAFPSLAVQGDGVIGVFWGKADGNIYGNKVSSAGTAGTPVLISPAPAAAAAGASPCAAYIGGTTAVVCWKATADSYLYARRFNINDNAIIGSETDLGLLDASDAHGAVAAQLFGNIMFVYKTGASALKAIVYDNTLANPGSEITVSAAASGDQFGIAANGRSFVITYDNLDTEQKLYVVNYDTLGTVIGTATEVVTPTANTIDATARPAIALCGGNCVAAWHDYSGGTPASVVGQGFSLAGFGASVAYNGSTYKGRSMRHTIDGNNQLTTDVYGTLNVASGDLRTSGNVYIGGTLNVASITFEGDLCVDGNIVATGSVAGQGTCPSDRRIKTNVKALAEQRGLDLVKQLKPITYNWTQDWIKRKHESDSVQLGLIAQELEPLVPEAVGQLHESMEGKKDLLGVKYEKLVPILILAIKQLNEKVELLETRLGK